MLIFTSTQSAEETSSKHQDEMMAYAKYEFAKASYGRSSDREKEEKFSSFKNSTSQQEVIVGSIPEGGTFQMRKTMQPGVLDVEWKTVCEILPTKSTLFKSINMSDVEIESRLSGLKNRCIKQTQELSFCVNLSILVERDLVPIQISEAMLRIRHNCPALKSRDSIAFFGLKFDTTTKFQDPAVIHTVRAKTYGECFLQCADPGLPRCFAWVFRNDDMECDLCRENCRNVKLCPERSDCSGGLLGSDDVELTDRPKYALLPHNVNVNGDIVHSSLLEKVLTAFEWCGTFYFPLSVAGGYTKLKSSPSNVTDLPEAFRRFNHHMMGPEIGHRCKKICGWYGSNDYLVTNQFPQRSELESALKVEVHGADIFVTYCTHEMVVEMDPHPTLTLKFVCDCFANGSVRSLNGLNRRPCQKRDVPGKSQIDTCDDMRFKAFASHGF